MGLKYNVVSTNGTSANPHPFSLDSPSKVMGLQWLSVSLHLASFQNVSLLTLSPSILLMHFIKAQLKMHFLGNSLAEHHCDVNYN